MLPLILDLVGKKVAIFGAGEVGLRKAQYFSKEAEVVVVDRHIEERVQESRLKLVEEDAYESYERWINWADLVVAATDDPLLNDKICSYAKSVGKDFNRADGVGSFLIPSVIDKGNFIIAISTFGRSPAVSRALKEELESAIDVNWSLMVELQEEIRKEIKSRVLDQRLREKALRLIIKDKEILRMLGIDYTKAKNLAIEKIEKEMNGLQKREVA